MKKQQAAIFLTFMDGLPNGSMNSAPKYLKFALSLSLLLGLFLVTSAPIRAQPEVNNSAKEGFVLSALCPKGFELIESNRCKLKTQYQQYDSTQSRGDDGTQASLPSHRDGFSPQQIDLGRYLFFDPVLSGNNQQSCASCHQPRLGFTDGKALSVGASGEQTQRSAPSLWNSAFLNSFFWDARAASLEEQALGPLFSSVEMNASPEMLLNELNEFTNYPSLFLQAFPESPELSLENLASALAAFQTSLISLNSRYDQYALGNLAALNEQEILGLNVFSAFTARCSECHTPPLFTNKQIAVIGSPEEDSDSFDIGAEKTFNTPKLKGGFKVPSLRNIGLTAPYMHSGHFTNLSDVVQFYAKGRGHAVPENITLHLHWHIWEPKLEQHEVDAIVSFLETLTDQEYLPELPEKLPSGLMRK